MTSDRVGDFIIRIKNASAIGKRDVALPYSAHLVAIAKKLRTLGYLDSVEVEGEVKKVLKVGLAYDERGAAKVHGVKRISKPGRRLYVSHADVHGAKGGRGARIVSTSSGVLSDREARQRRAGGETLFDIW